MSAALALNWNESTKEVPELTQKHVEVLIELLRDVNLEKRMETLIKAQHLFDDTTIVEEQLLSIRNDLEEYNQQLRKMIFMVEQAQYFLNE